MADGVQSQGACCSGMQPKAIATRLPACPRAVSGNRKTTQPLKGPSIFNALPAPPKKSRYLPLRADARPLCVSLNILLAVVIVSVPYFL